MPRPIKILHVLHAFSAGGLENGVVNIINNSPEHLQHELCLMTKGGDFLRRLNRPVTCHEIDKQGGNSWVMVFRLRDIISRAGPHIVHTRNWGAFDMVLAACLVPRVKVLHGEHGRDIEDPNGLIRRRNFIRRALSYRVQNFIAVSADLRKWLSEVVGISERKILLIHNGVDTERFRPRRNEALRQKLGIGPAEFVIGTIGRLDPVKDHKGILEALHVMASRGARARLVVVGDGPERPRLEEEIRRLGLQDLAILAGYRTEVEDFYGIFDVFVLNSIAEGMSNTILEAMASGLPVICTPQGGNVELVEEGLTGTYVAVGDHLALAQALEQYCASPRLRSELGHKGRNRVEERFSLRTMLDRYIQLYECTAGVRH